MKRILLIVICVTLTIIFSPYSMAWERPDIKGLSGFAMQDISADHSTSGKRSTPLTIPKDWKLISVSNGEKVNNNNLWFQDVDGNVYLIDGFMSGGRFIMSPGVQRLNAK
jgi:hypothetical protein